jgi:hypothetical protein
MEEMEFWQAIGQAVRCFINCPAKNFCGNLTGEQFCRNVLKEFYQTQVIKEENNQ